MRNLIASLALLLFAGFAGAAGYPRELVVKIGTETPVGSAFGSAVVLREGFLLSAEHLSKMPDMRTQSGLPVKVVKTDEQVDIGLYQAEGVKCPCVELADSDAKMDEPVIIISFPYNITSTVTRGESQGVHVVDELGPRLVTTALVAGGSSGGGVFALRDGRWQLVGVLAEGNSLHSLAVPVSAVRAFLAKE
jgi:S1-C subfamily serine protease